MSSMRLSSSRRPKPSRPTAVRPELCAKLLGEHIQLARLRDGRPLDKIAPLAGLTVPEWEAIEAGQAPDTWEHICLIAAALHIGRTSMPWLVKLYVGAGKQ